MDLLKHVKQLSGPASAHAFKVDFDDGEKNIKSTSVYLFGDVHFSYNNACPRCTANGGCYDIVKFINKAEEHCASKNVNLDVFLELPYVAKDRHGLDYIDTYFASNSSAAVKFRNTLSKFVGKPPKVIGMLSKLYSTFKDKIYSHDKKQTLQDHGSAKQRFHYADTRFEHHANLITPPMSSSHNGEKVVDWMMDFHARVNSADKFCRILETFTMSKNFANDLRQLMGDKTQVLDKSLSNVNIAGKSYRVHKVAKQYLNLPDDLRPVAEQYIRARIEYVRSFMIDVLNYDFHARQVQGLALDKVTSTRHELDMARSLIWTGLMAYISQLAYPGIMLVCCMIIMDAYMVCRMLRYMFESKDGSCVIVYTGDAHTSHYVDFMVNYLGKHSMGKKRVQVSPIMCRAMPEIDSENTAMRCVSTTNQRCDPKELDAMIRDKMYK